MGGSPFWGGFAAASVIFLTLTDQSDAQYVLKSRKAHHN